MADFPRLGREFVEHLVRAMLSHRLEAASLPDMKAGHVWRSATGGYAIDDESLAEYLFDPESKKPLTL